LCAASKMRNVGSEKRRERALQLTLRLSVSAPAPALDCGTVIVQGRCLRQACPVPVPRRDEEHQSRETAALHMDRYEIILFWSAQDEVFVAEVPELPGCMAHGDTQEEALANAKQAMVLWLDTAREFGDDIPEPKGHRLVFA